MAQTDPKFLAQQSMNPGYQPVVKPSRKAIGNNVWTQGDEVGLVFLVPRGSVVAKQWKGAHRWSLEPLTQKVHIVTYWGVKL